MTDPTDEALDKLIRGVARTPPVSSIRRAMGPGVELAGRFEITKKLGAGGMGQVFQAFDRTLQAPVALKVLGNLTPRSIGQLKSEFRSAAELAHPNLVRLLELFSDETEWFFTMELVLGASLPELNLRESPPERLREIFRQLACGLRALHQAGSVHSDLKPSNFLVTHEEGRVVLLDFGLARPIGLDQGSEWAGTPAYMAPEQALGETLTEAADWYTFGVVLYEALTGVLPMRNPSPERLADAPGDMKTLCLELLRLDPAERPRGEEVLRRVGNPPGAAPLSIAPTSRRVFVGREPELEVLQTAFESTRSGGPAMVLLQGPSGIGKTALVSRWLERARARGALVLAGSCKERESMAYKAVDGLVDDLVTALDNLPERAARTVLPNDMADLTVLFPALRAASLVGPLPNARSDASDQGIQRLRAVAAFRELFARLGLDSPIVVWIDDVQWSDTDSAKLIGPMLEVRNRIPLLFIASYRPSSAGRGPLLDALFQDPSLDLPEPREVSVGPLHTEDAEALARELLATHAPNVYEVAKNIGRDTGGHPLFIAELAHAASAPGSISAPAASTLLELITQRVAALPDSAQSLLATTAIAGTSLPRSVLRLAQGLSASETEAALDVLKANRLARSHGLRDDAAVDVHHDRIRDIVLQNLRDEDRKRCHLKLANVLSTLPESTADFLASHYQAAGELARAGSYWIAAADDASRALAFSHAADLYERGLGQAALEAAEQRAVQVRRAEALSHAGKGSRAADVYLSVAETSAPEEAVELTRRAAEQLLLSGHLERGMSTIDQVLTSIGMRTTRSGYRALLSVAFGRALVRMRGLDYVARTEAEIPRQELVRLDASWTVTCSLGVTDPLRGAEFQSKHMLLALRCGEPRRLLRAIIVEASYAAISGAGSERRTTPLLAVADQLAREPEDEAGETLLQVCKGLVAYLQGKLPTALVDLENALDTLTRRRFGAIWETITAQRFVVASLFFLGRLRRLSEYVPPLLAQAEGTGNLYATMCFRTAYSWGAWLARDDVAEVRRQVARARDEWKTSGFQLCHCNILIAEAYADLYSGDPEAAFRRIQEQWPAVEAARLLSVGVLRVQLWQLRAASAVAAANSFRARGQHSTARELLREAEHWTRRLRKDPMGRAGPCASLVEAAVRCSEGDSERARTLLEQAAESFDAERMSLFAAAARARRGILLGGDAGARLVELAHADFGREGVVDPQRMVDMLAPGFPLSA